MDKTMKLKAAIENFADSVAKLAKEMATESLTRAEGGVNRISVPLVGDAIARNPGIQRAQLAELTGIAPLKITHICQQLQSSGLVRKQGGKRYAKWYPAKEAVDHISGLLATLGQGRVSHVG